MQPVALKTKGTMQITRTMSSCIFKKTFIDDCVPHLSSEGVHCNTVIRVERNLATRIFSLITNDEM